MSWKDTNLFRGTQGPGGIKMLKDLCDFLDRAEKGDWRG